ncbi:thioredoxin-dependent thiol peroxidase [Alicyclobacillus fastidiosus]|uniref:thioredoxin-dependent peroxiredoxin n=1 Tax=Alicyclobacillus fastidiosus TaxID=392011 RepID=A0ABY6ZE25_9BACL|nr:thioredoxin-dependent thiol peroxidase [Alicyclobacillus fastidiosus]WAH40762.1 thioredoxin-dependent thiol peroxidase [Alicyclobacillus fastidiosus]GMA62235.1 putative peroxiredoxin bcp [Alicyclobacillus fastidiosus]
MSELHVGDVAPDFSSIDQDGNTVSLEGLKGQVVVLYFYPKDDTPGCTKEACAFRDMSATFAEAGAAIYGVSRDTAKSHQKFREKYSLNFPLLADEDSAICEAYGVLKEKNMYGKTSIGIERTTFIIDADGKIAAIFPKVKVDGHVDEVLAKVRDLV